MRIQPFVDRTPRKKLNKYASYIKIFPADPKGMNHYGLSSGI